MRPDNDNYGLSKSLMTFITSIYFAVSITPLRRDLVHRKPIARPTKLRLVPRADIPTVCGKPQSQQKVYNQKHQAHFYY